LADPDFNKSGKVDLLLGADIFFNLLSSGRIRLGKNMPTLQKTLLGWIVSCNYQFDSTKFSLLSTLLEQSQDKQVHLEKPVSKFWEIEEVPQNMPLSEEQRLCERHYTDTTVRLPNGRFCVKLPFKCNTIEIGNSYEIAKRRFLSLERRISNKTDVYEQYIQFMKEYL